MKSQGIWIWILSGNPGSGTVYNYFKEAGWPSGRASDSGARGQGLDRHSGRQVVSLSKIHLPPKKVLVIPRKRWLCRDMTEKLLTGM